MPQPNIYMQFDVVVDDEVYQQAFPNKPSSKLKLFKYIVVSP